MAVCHDKQSWFARSANRRGRLHQSGIQLGNMYTASEEQGVSPETILPIKSLMKSAVKNGHGDAGLSALIEYFASEPRK